MTDLARDDDRPAVLEIYKLAVEMADRVSARRSLANNFYLTIHSALVAGLLLSASDQEPMTPLSGAILTCVAAAGIALALLWWCSLDGYRRLNRAKYKAINQIEEALPAKPLSQEWGFLEREKPASWRHAYRELGWSERKVPLLFIALYAAVVTVEAMQIM